MRVLALFAAVPLMFASLALAAAPEEVVVQGLYEGSCKTAAGEQKFEARVVAIGKGNYKVLIRVPAADGKVTKSELAGTTAGDAVTFKGKADAAEWEGAYVEGTIKGKCKDGTFEMRRVVRQSPTLGAKPPAGAIVLLDGKNFDELTIKAGKDGKTPEWKIVEEGAIQIPRGGMNSKRSFAGSYKLHVEFRNPFMPAASGQGRGNSGCYQANGDEIQVLDSFGMETYLGGGCGGIYKYKDPDTFDVFSLASAPPMQWQTYDIEYRVTRQDGKVVGKPKITVLHNGIKIHDNAELRNAAKPGTLHFQDHGNPVCYRNMWIVELTD